MRALTKVHGEGERRARVSDELRQLKQMSKGLRTMAVHALLKRDASEPLEGKRVSLPTAKTPSSAAAA
jgi:hypothetical protein